MGGLGGGGGDGEDSALHRRGNGAVGPLRRHIHRAGKVGAGADFFALQGLREAAQELGEDDATIAACAQERPMGHCARDSRCRGLLGLAGFRKRGLAGLHHVGAGIAVRHRVDVQGVHGGHVCLQPAHASLEHGLEVGAV